ncbi:hypothetical protein HDU93_005221 [Gonapodya sp. JEL0774]|nr:hypothetical protein HDU93_005221 [Gonapodya sp. JEL0774]
MLYVGDACSTIPMIPSANVSDTLAILISSTSTPCPLLTKLTNVAALNSASIAVLYPPPDNLETLTTSDVGNFTSFAVAFVSANYGAALTDLALKVGNISGVAGADRDGMHAVLITVPTSHLVSASDDLSAVVFRGLTSSTLLGAAAVVVGLTLCSVGVVYVRRYRIARSRGITLDELALELAAGNKNLPHLTPKELAALPPIRPYESPSSQGQESLKAPLPASAASLFELARTALDKAEAAISSRVVAPSQAIAVTQSSTSESVSSSSSLVPSLPNFIPDTPILLPIVPTSPLSKALVAQASEYKIALRNAAAASKHQLDALGNTLPRDLGALRRVHEAAHSEKRRLDAAVEAVTKFSSPDFTVQSFTPQLLAKELATIDAQLFRSLLGSTPDLRDSLILAARHDHPYGAALDPQLRPLRACLDFHTYLRHVFVDTIISAQRENPSVTSAAARAHVIQHLVATGIALQRGYRSYSALAAIVLALSSPSVRRLKNSWALVDGRWREWIERVALTMMKQEGRADAKGWDGYFAEIKDALEIFYNPPLHTITPWLHPFLDTLRDLVRLYGLASDQSPPPTPSLSSSKPSLALTVSASNILERPRHPLPRRPAPAPPGLLHPTAGLRWSGRESAAGKIVSAQMTQELSKLSSDSNVRHWLVTRVYVGERELWERSLGVEPPRGEGEKLPDELEREDAEATGWQGVMERAVELATDIDAARNEEEEEDDSLIPPDAPAMRHTQPLSEPILESSAVNANLAQSKGSTDAILEIARSGGDKDPPDEVVALTTMFPSIPTRMPDQSRFVNIQQTIDSSSGDELGGAVDPDGSNQGQTNNAELDELDRELSEMEITHRLPEGHPPGRSHLDESFTQPLSPPWAPSLPLPQNPSIPPALPPAPFPPLPQPPSPLTSLRSPEEFEGITSALDLDFLDRLAAQSPEHTDTEPANSGRSGPLIDFDGGLTSGSASQAGLSASRSWVPPLQPPQPFHPSTVTLPPKSSLSSSSNGSAVSLDHSGKPKKKVRIHAEGDYVPGPWEDDAEVEGIVGGMGIAGSAADLSQRPQEDQYSELWKRLGALGGVGSGR